MSIREAGPDDLAAVLRLYGQLNPDDPVLSSEAAAATFGRILDSPLLRLLVLEEAGEVVATTYLNLIPNLTRNGAPYAVIENVVVDEARRGSGAGKRIMAATLAAAWEAGCYKAMLLTSSKQESTHAFYRACGFAGDIKTGYVTHPPSPAGRRADRTNL